MADSVFHPEARAEYEAAIAWYQARSPRASMRFEAEVDRVLGVIANSPEMYPNYDADHRFVVLRRFPYSIVYQVQPGKRTSSRSPIPVDHRGIGKAGPAPLTATRSPPSNTCRTPWRPRALR